MSNLTAQSFQDFKDYITEVNNNFYDGGQIVFKFPNGYGASLVNHRYSYGNEMAILKGDDICYDTGITDDVLAYLKNHEIIEALHRIKNLKASNIT